MFSILKFVKNPAISSIFHKLPAHFFLYLAGGVMSFSLIIGTGVLFWKNTQDRQRLLSETQHLSEQKEDLENQLNMTTDHLSSVSAELTSLKNEDQLVKNKQLEEEIKNIQITFKNSLVIYEDLMDLRGDGAKTQTLDDQFAQALANLSKRNYSSASATLQKITADIEKLKLQLAASGGPIPQNLKVTNTPPGSGYSKQVVDTDAGQFVVDILAADLNNTRVQVETASSGDCKDNCPVAALADYVGRSGGFAGINGPYFCPASYPSCAGKTNSFDTLIMNKSKTYFNSDNNVYSVVPALVFSGNQARMMKSAEVGRDTGVDAVIAGQPALISGGEVAFGGDGDPKKGSRGPRSFIAAKGNFVYIGVVRGATVSETARVLKALGMQVGLNLDSGGSTAFMVNGKYVVGPGRATPFGIVLVRK